MSRRLQPVPQQPEGQDSPSLDRVLFSHAQALHEVQKTALLDGHQLDDVDVATSATEIKHLLGRKPKGFVVVDKDADARVWRSATSTSTLLTLRASAAVTVSLWVY